MAFRTAARDAFFEAFRKSRPCLQEPIMTVEVEMPVEFQGPIVGDLNSRRGIIMETEARDTCAVVRAEVPLANMFGYATVVRGLSKGMATFSMEMSRYARVPAKLAEEIISRRREEEQQIARK
jgi:elongation factor G